MEKLLEKISSYNLFTNIVPGYLLLMFNIYYFHMPRLNNLEGLLLAYFIGQTLNRIGSLLITNTLKLTKEKGEDYSRYITADSKDAKIKVLLQERNSYRTICAMLIVIIIEILFKDLLMCNCMDKDSLLLTLL